MKEWSWKSKYVLLVLCFTVWNKREAVLLMTHMMDFRWCHRLIEHKDSGLSVTTAKISIWNCALSPWTLQGTWFQKSRIKVTRVTDTHCVGTNQIQTGRCLVTASSRATALHDNSLSLLNTSKNIFSLFSLLSDSLSQQEGLSPLAFEEGQQQGGFCSSSLSPLSSLTEPVGCCASLEFPYQGRKIPSDCRNPNLPQRWMGDGV